jgi:1-deoxy-D-xylulose-5-phosphate reductoisomerase
MAFKNVVILGSTGTIGINTLKVIDRYPDRFQVVGLSACKNLKEIEAQIHKYHPTYVAVQGDQISKLRRCLTMDPAPEILDVHHELEVMICRKDVDIVVIGMSGRAALEPFLSAVRAGKTVAPANKEALVIAGEMIMQAARQYGAKVIPVDSEQSAIFQCLEGNRKQDLQKIVLTASGGPLDQVPAARFDELSLEDILKHPRWKMGRKITVDSATLMNKGFEVIEAARLFDLQVDDIEVVIHPEAIIHSMVCYKDGSLLAQLGVPDMQIPIQFALTYPERWSTGFPSIDFCQLAQLNFRKPDLNKFPCLALAIHTAKQGGTLPAVLNAADEVAVQAFLDGRIAFSAIYKTVAGIVEKHRIRHRPSLEEIREADDWARETTKDFLGLDG